MLAQIVHRGLRKSQVRNWTRKRICRNDEGRDYRQFLPEVRDAQIMSPGSKRQVNCPAVFARYVKSKWNRVLYEKAIALSRARRQLEFER